MSGVEQTLREVYRWLSYGTPQGLVTSARVLRHKSLPVYQVLFSLSVLRKDIDGWTSKGSRMVIDELGRTERGKNTRVEEKADYCEGIVNMVACSELHRRELICIDWLQQRDGRFPPYSGEAHISSPGWNQGGVQPDY